jgi:hypothetical protein
MRFYRVTTQGKEHATWATTQADVALIKKMRLEEGFKRKHISVEEVDIPTTKDALTIWLNANVMHLSAIGSVD